MNFSFDMPHDHGSRLPEPLARCPFCSTAYRSHDLRGLKDRQGSQVTHATCGKCQRAMLFAVDRRTGQVVCVGLFTDCTAEDAARFDNNEKISLDEVLNTHVSLRK